MVLIAGCRQSKRSGHLGFFNDASAYTSSRRKSVYAQNRELEALEARIKAAEERLKQAGSESSTLTTTKNQSPERASETAKAIFTTMETSQILEEVSDVHEQPAGGETRMSNEYVIVERPRAAKRRGSQAHESNSHDEQHSE